MNFSEQQKAGIDWALKGKGSLNMIARAGCGKTTFLLGVVEALGENQDWNGPIFIGAFNKSIALVMKGKLEAKGLKFPFVNASTMHALGFSLWRSRAPKVKVNEQKVEELILEGGFKWDEENLGVLKQAISLAKQSGCGALWEAADHGEWYRLLDWHAVECEDQERLVERAQAILEDSIALDPQMIDFDDMLLAPLVHRVTTRYPYKWVLIDEAQDTNATRRALALSVLMPKSGRLIACGDDRQAIYGFTGADSDAMELFKNALGSSELPLNVTYRCPKAVVKEANKYVGDLRADEGAPEGAVGHLKLAAERSEEGAETFGLKGFRPADAVLCRNTAPLVRLAYQCLSKQIPVHVEGREIGKGLKKLAMRWRVQNLGGLEDKLDLYLHREQAKWMAKNRPDRAGLVDDQVSSLKALISAAREMKQNATVQDLIGLIDKMFTDTDPEDRSILTLSTIHKAKGREWPRVFILDASKLMPSPYARQEWQKKQEENLAYVAITRAMEELIYLEN